MRRMSRLLLAVAGTLALLVLPSVAQAGHTTDPRTNNMHPLGHIIEPAVLGGFGGANPDVNTDIAFQGNLAYQGNWDGFSIRDISDPENPTTVSRTFCDGNQGDIVVYRNILVRAWNTTAGATGPFGAGTSCDGQSVPLGFEGVHVFKLDDLNNPELVADVELSARPAADAFGCGSHTLTLAPDLANNRVIVYNQTSGGPCPFVGILEVPLDNPAGARWLRNEPLDEADAAHDTGIILGDVNLMAVASHDHANVYDIGANDRPGGSLTDPVFLYTINEPGVCNEPGNPLCNGNWHSAAFTWDGDTIVLGWEPGGGLQAECEASDPVAKKSFFFYDSEDGSKLGQWTLPRPQGANENCTLHNYNLVPLKNGDDVMVSGNYQAGTWVIDLTDPASPQTVGWSDPPPADPVPLPSPPPFCTAGGGCPLTGAWSTYWYNGFLYESHIGEGLNIFRLSGNTLAKRIKLDRLNPQTQEFSLPE
jgi:LVIVD repeat